MLESSRITTKQFIFMLVLSRIVIDLTNVPDLKIMYPSQDYWIACLLFAPVQIILGLPIYFLAKRFPQQTIIQYSQTLLGTSGIVVAALLLWYFIHQTAILLARFGLLITTVSMPATPILFFFLTMTLACAYAVWKGIEVIGRLSELFFYLFFVAILVVALLS